MDLPKIKCTGIDRASTLSNLLGLSAGKRAFFIPSS